MGEMINFSEGVRIGCSDKSFGNMSFLWGEADKVRGNRERFLSQTLGIALNSCIAMRVEDADKVVSVVLAEAGLGMEEVASAIKTDGLVTDIVGLGLFLVVGDCLPVVYYDPIRPAIGLAHLSWKSTNLGLASKMVREMARLFGSKPEDIKVWLGPGAKKESYVLEHLVQKDDKEWNPFIGEVAEGEWSVDLYGFNRKKLLESGVAEENIFESEIDTIANDKYFSHYRAIRNFGEQEGRYAVSVALNEKL